MGEDWSMAAVAARGRKSGSEEGPQPHLQLRLRYGSRCAGIMRTYAAAVRPQVLLRVMRVTGPGGRVAFGCCLDRRLRDPLRGPGARALARPYFMQ